MTFTLPFLLGIGAALLLDFDLKAAVLIGSLFASHTLLVYPQVRAAGVAQDRAVATAVGGTVITDTAALITLAVVAGLQTGDERRADPGPRTRPLARDPRGLVLCRPAPSRPLVLCRLRP